MPKIQHYLLIALLCICNPATAHIAGVTDTHISIKKNTVELLYTLPTDSLQELPVDTALSLSDANQKAVKDGFKLVSDGQACTVTASKERSLENIGSQQFAFIYDCHPPIDTLQIGYNLFFEENNSHKNFARISLAGHSQNVNFSNSYQNHTVEVAELLQRLIELRKNNPTAQIESPSSSHYFFVGVEHILLGFDHLLFLLALLLLPLKFRQLLVLITSFTLAHSITLALSVLDIVTLPVPMVEVTIAFSIMFVALESVLELNNSRARIIEKAIWKRRLINTFLFGLIHGFGFSYILKNMGLGEQVAGSLLYFNLGVEAGQLLAIALTFPLLQFLFRRYSSIRWAQALAFVVALVALYWLAERFEGLL